MRARFTAACAATATAVVSLVALGQVTAGPAAAAPTTPTASATPAHVKAEKVCTTPTRGHLGCFAIKQVAPVEPAAVTPNALPSGYGPGDLRSAYALTASGSSTQTVAIVDAQDDPNAAADLATYRSTYGLPSCTTSTGCFQKVNQSGATSPLPSADSGWAGEISLDLDMVSAICPNCHILLVEASSATTANLGTAVNTAVRLGAKYVSNSYGGPEDSSVTSADSSYYIHPGVVITASAGDADYDGGSYPATGAGVTAVGGTSLVRNSSSRGWGETVWNTTSYSEGTGSGCSKYIAKPAFQNGISTGCSKRAEADVSAVADPATGVAVYQTYGGSGWAVYGGTSAASPIIASVYALAGTPGSSDSPNAYPYAHPGNLNDVTSGSNGTCGAPICTAGTGWDGPTGLGTPNGTAAFTSGGSTGGGGTGGGGGTTGTCTTGQRIGNPGFESGNTVWSASSGVIAQNGSSGEPARSGTWNAWLDGYGTTTTDTLTQSVSIPAGCTNSTLSFYLHIDTAETGSTAYDKLVVKLGSTTLATYSNVNANSGYSVHTFKVGSFAGQTVTLSFTGSEDSSDQTSFVLDDTALNAA